MNSAQWEIHKAIKNHETLMSELVKVVTDCSAIMIYINFLQLSSVIFLLCLFVALHFVY